ncbi:hypothetical protein AVEN_136926-1 [Araneus ventricosus]|uniref:Uncharacterized protein n=1 Tax=Araneus ventricosus TaxID=182803 RepID=A0A4Y2BI75_ARAVE|nr:hypothetical protein AVEN_136926-1 [Araneus ventricosus]
MTPGTDPFPWRCPLVMEPVECRQKRALLRELSSRRRSLYHEIVTGPRGRVGEPAVSLARNSDEDAVALCAGRLVHPQQGLWGNTLIIIIS